MGSRGRAARPPAQVRIVMRQSPGATPQQVELARKFLAELSDKDLKIFDDQFVRIINEPQWWFRTCIDLEKDRRAGQFHHR